MANEYITGIGDGEDLSFVGIKHHTIADIDIEPAGIIGTTRVDGGTWSDASQAYRRWSQWRVYS